MAEASTRVAVYPDVTALLEARAGTSDGHSWSGSLRPGDRVGRFEVLRELGRGGFGAVYEALDERLRRGPLPLRQAVDVALQASRALAYVHGAGVVHRDLKPGNMWLAEDGRVRLLDLGLAAVLGRERTSAAGTPAYVAAASTLKGGTARTTSSTGHGQGAAR